MLLLEGCKNDKSMFSEPRRTSVVDGAREELEADSR